MSSIYELTGEYLELMNMLEDEEVDEQTIIDTLEALDGEIENKADNYAKIIRSLESDIDGISKENNRLAASILVICQEKFKIVFDMFFLKKGALHRRSLIIFLKNERYSDSVFNSASSFSPVYSWFLTSKPKTSRTNLRDVSASALLC